MGNSPTPKEMAVMDRLTGSEPIDWIKHNIDLTSSDSAEAACDDEDYQNVVGLPTIHQTFDGSRRDHFTERGRILDFAVSMGCGRVLDFGPGDGLPCLGFAPMVDEVIGVDASPRRVAACSQNSQKLGLTNVHFVHGPSVCELPFPDESFDGVSAAASVEQTSDPKSTLRELRRVLKPGGNLRVQYRSVGYYCGWKEREATLRPVGSGSALLILDRDVETECVRHYQLRLDLSVAQAAELITGVKNVLWYGP